MEKSIVTTGKTIDLAVQAALDELKMDRDNVSVEVLENAKSGFLGIGSSPAKVKVTYEVPDLAPAPALSSASRSKPKKPSTPAAAPAPEAPKASAARPAAPKAAPAPKAEKPAAPRADKPAAPQALCSGGGRQWGGADRNLYHRPVAAQGLRRGAPCLEGRRQCVQGGSDRKRPRLSHRPPG